MSEKLAEVYEQYDMEILATRKGRGATILTTTDGLRILEPFRGSLSRLEQEYVLKQLFLDVGYDSLDELIPNREGQLLTADRYRQPFVMKRHFDGNECDMQSAEEILRAVRALATFHIKGREVAGRYPQRLQEYREEKDRQRVEMIRRAAADGEEMERIAYVYEISPGVLREVLDGGETALCAKRQTNGGAREEEPRYAGKLAADFVRDSFVRHNRELAKIQKYISRVRKKNEFENTFLKIVPQYIRQGKSCVEMYDGMVSGKNGISLDRVVRDHFGICHGSFNQHNVILGERGEAIVHFERFSRGNQLEDLYQFARKAMEKNHFAYELLERLLCAYGAQIPLTREDYYYLYMLFSYPEKFWKIANGYYNSNKAFLSPKYLEKLRAVIRQEEEKQELLRQYWGFHSA